MKRDSYTSYLFWSTIAILVGISFAAGIVEIIKKERNIELTISQNKKQTISSATKTVEIAPTVSAESYIITSLSTGKIISAQNIDEVLPIASLTKLVTAVVTLDNIKDHRIQITPEDKNEEGDTGRLVVGETLTAKELLYPLLMVSSNDSAAALARSMGKADFVAKMNAWAWSIGATNTAFVDPTGLSYGNVSNAKDMTTIISWIQKNRPEIFAITTLKTKYIKGHVWVNKTHFLNMSEYIGGKNGFTDEAKRTSVSLFSYPELGKDFEKIAIVILKSSDRTKDVLALLHSIVVK